MSIDSRRLVQGSAPSVSVHRLRDPEHKEFVKMQDQMYIITCGHEFQYPVVNGQNMATSGRLVVSESPTRKLFF